MTTYIVVNHQKQSANKTAEKAAEILIKSGVKVAVNETDSDFNIEGAIKMPEQQALKTCDVIITVGGDGTILKAARKSLKYNKPILGINVGRLGFLATVEANELNLLKRLISGEYKTEQRSILCAYKNSDTKHTQTAINDVVIGKSCVAQAIDIKIYCDDTLVSDYRGDGVIISTPTGSTAYSLSAGGPVLDAEINGIVVTPLCAHSLNSPSLVFSSHRKLRVKASCEGKTKMLYSCDGQADLPLFENDEITVCADENRIKLISFNSAQQFMAIDKKLKGR